jgi:hypothetical protein
MMPPPEMYSDGANIDCNQYKKRYEKSIGFIEYPGKTPDKNDYYAEDEPNPHGPFVF